MLFNTVLSTLCFSTLCFHHCAFQHCAFHHCAFQHCDSRRRLEEGNEADLSKGSTALNVKGQQSKDNIHGDGSDDGNSSEYELAPGPSSYGWDPTVVEGGVTIFTLRGSPSPSTDGPGELETCSSVFMFIDS